MKQTIVSLFWKRFRGDQHGNVATIAALSMLGLVGTAGLGIDYYNALAAKSRLDLASDAAAIAAINAAQSYIELNSATQTDPALTAAAITAGKAQAQNVFKINAGSTANLATTPAVTMARSGQTFNASISYQASSQNAFGPIFGVNRININGGSSSSLTMGKYLDFYLLLDVSGSMGLPTTTAGQTQLAAISPDNKNVYPGGCTFACHFSQKMCTTIAKPSTSQTCQGYSLGALQQYCIARGFRGFGGAGHAEHGAVNDDDPTSISHRPLSVHFTNGHALCDFQQFNGGADGGGNARQLARYGPIDEHLWQRRDAFRERHSGDEHSHHECWRWIWGSQAAALCFYGDGWRRQQSILYDILEQLDGIAATKYGPHALRAIKKSRDHGGGSLHPLSTDHQSERKLRE